MALAPASAILRAGTGGEGGGRGHLAANLLAFARLLRRAGLPVGAGEVLAAAEALTIVDLADRAQVQAALRAVMVHRREHFELFDQAFALFWRDPEAGRQAAALELFEAGKEKERPPPTARRVAEALMAGRPRPAPQEAEPPPPLREATLTVSERERLQKMDFEAMSAAEIAEAKREIRRLVLPLDERRTRRFRADPAGPAVDLRATIRASLREGGEILTLVRRRRLTRPPPLVVLCDISGSMARYAQILLHFVHAVTNARDRVHVFLFGTRLTNVTRQLRHRDPEVAFELVSHVVPDWSGGTRIGESLTQFNRLWARRVLGQGAVVLLITDGLDREGAKGLAEATDRLRRSCRRLIWLNPLLRFAGFQPKSQGIRAMLPHVDEFRPVHNLESLRALVETLSAPRRAGPGRRAA
ncbi:vWA domain-containing protein [Caldovatus aquaticus]|uniref:VWA domain-containing protein n=1 Tax=Caldovatus aquaticus TaxID=2865671 RepID=A0ABS7F0M9_9PROT|nr:VWA domain-containing protein [Caldovatus aquaticus]MBW8268522.1 VWA domain-containing protein [Caldovatus aquaticus]